MRIHEMPKEISITKYVDNSKIKALKSEDWKHSREYIELSKIVAEINEITSDIKDDIEILKNGNFDSKIKKKSSLFYQNQYQFPKNLNKSSIQLLKKEKNANNMMYNYLQIIQKYKNHGLKSKFFHNKNRCPNTINSFNLKLNQNQKIPSNIFFNNTFILKNECQNKYSKKINYDIKAYSTTEAQEDQNFHRNSSYTKSILSMNPHKQQFYKINLIKKDKKKFINKIEKESSRKIKNTKSLCNSRSESPINSNFTYLKQFSIKRPQNLVKQELDLSQIAISKSIKFSFKPPSKQKSAYRIANILERKKSHSHGTNFQIKIHPLMKNINKDILIK